MEHFVTFPYTFTHEQETNMAVASMMTCKICLIWRHMKTPYYIHTTWVSHVHHMGITSTPHGYHMYTTWVLHPHHMGITCTPHGYHMYTTWVILDQKLNYIRLPPMTLRTSCVGLSRIRSHLGFCGITLTTGDIPWLYSLPCLLRFIMLILTSLFCGQPLTAKWNQVLWKKKKNKMCQEIFHNLFLQTLWCPNYLLVWNQYGKILEGRLRRQNETASSGFTCSSYGYHMHPTPHGFHIQATRDRNYQFSILKLYLRTIWISPHVENHRVTTWVSHAHLTNMIYHMHVTWVSHACHMGITFTWLG